MLVASPYASNEINASKVWRKIAQTNNNSVCLGSIRFPLTILKCVVSSNWPFSLAALLFLLLFRFTISPAISVYWMKKKIDDKQYFVRSSSIEIENRQFLKISRKKIPTCNSTHFLSNDSHGLVHITKMTWFNALAAERFFFAVFLCRCCHSLLLLSNVRKESKANENCLLLVSFCVSSLGK